jgi:predicted alpha/beta-hydrolase family hydrolase
LEARGHEVVAHTWRHWRVPDTEFSLETELSDNESELEAGPGGGQLAVIGKSVGVFVAAALLTRSPAHAARARRLLLFGIPIAGARESERAQLHTALSQLDVPVTVCQNKDDPYGAAGNVREFLQGLTVEFAERDADNHRYDYPEYAAEIIGRG